MRVGNYRDLEVWKMSMDMVDLVYQYASKFPAREQFILVKQICSAAVSVPSNIAEGSGRTGKKELAHHLSIARGSLCEVETQAIIAWRRKYIDDNEWKDLDKMCISIGKMLTRFIQSLQP